MINYSHFSAINNATPSSADYIDDTSDEEKEITAFKKALPQFLAVGVKNILLFGMCKI